MSIFYTTLECVSQYERHKGRRRTLFCQESWKSATLVFLLSSYQVMYTSTLAQWKASISAWIPHGQETLQGVIIPDSSVVRHLGQSYVYIQLSEEQFVRRSIPIIMRAQQGYFVRHNIFPGEKLVTTGAQMLLSEEFRGQIPDEDDDD